MICLLLILYDLFVVDFIFKLSPADIAPSAHVPVAARKSPAAYCRALLTVAAWESAAAYCRALPDAPAAF